MPGKKHEGNGQQYSSRNPFAKSPTKAGKPNKQYDIEDLTSSFKGLLGSNPGSIKKHHDEGKPQYFTTKESIHDGTYKHSSPPRLKKQISYGNGLPKNKWQVETAERRRKENIIHRWEAKQSLSPKDIVYFPDVTPPNARLQEHMNRPKTPEENRENVRRNAERAKYVRRIEARKAEDAERRERAFESAEENRRRNRNRYGF